MICWTTRISQMMLS